MEEKLIIAVQSYAQARDAFFAASGTDDLDALRNVYHQAAHAVAFLVWLDAPKPPAAPTDAEWKAHNAAQRLEANLPSHPGFKRLMVSIEQHDPLDLEVWEQTHAMVRARCIQNDPDCPNTGWPVACSKCNYCSQNMEEGTMEPEPDENQDVDSSDWTTAATEEELMYQPGDSRDLFDEYDDDDAYEW